MRQVITICIGLGLIWFLLTKTESGTIARQELIQTVPQRIIQTIKELPQTTIPSPLPVAVPLDSVNVAEAINTVRQMKKVPVLTTNRTLCPLADQISKNESLSDQTIKTNCPSCGNVISLSLSTQAGTESAMSYIMTNSTASAIVSNTKLKNICVVANTDQTGVVAASIVVPPSPKPIKNISEDELWQALTEYRQDHKVNELVRDNKLCEYARRRVDEHLALFASHKKPEEYPVPAKYPLDAHAGFKRDADSGYVFDATGKHEVAENLAYWPNAEYATHVIEWGWDSSTEGHRETQLSTNYSSGCLTGKQGFFVAIFGK